MISGFTSYLLEKISPSRSVDINSRPIDNTAEEEMTGEGDNQSTSGPALIGRDTTTASAAPPLPASDRVPPPPGSQTSVPTTPSLGSTSASSVAVLGAGGAQILTSTHVATSASDTLTATSTQIVTAVQAALLPILTSTVTSQITATMSQVENSLFTKLSQNFGGIQSPMLDPVQQYRAAAAARVSMGGPSSGLPFSLGDGGLDEIKEGVENAPTNPPTGPPDPFLMLSQQIAAQQQQSNLFLAQVMQQNKEALESSAKKPKRLPPLAHDKTIKLDSKLELKMWLIQLDENLSTHSPSLQVYFNGTKLACYLVDQVQYPQLYDPTNNKKWFDPELDGRAYTIWFTTLSATLQRYIREWEDQVKTADPNDYRINPTGENWEPRGGKISVFYAHEEIMKKIEADSEAKESITKQRIKNLKFKGNTVKSLGNQLKDLSEALYGTELDYKKLIRNLLAKIEENPKYKERVENIRFHQLAFSSSNDFKMGWDKMMVNLEAKETELNGNVPKTQPTAAQLQQAHNATHGGRGRGRGRDGGVRGGNRDAGSAKRPKSDPNRP